MIITINSKTTLKTLVKTVSLLRKLSPITLLRYWVLSTQKRILTSIEYSPKSIKIAGEALKSQLRTLFHQPIKRSIFTDNLKTNFIYPIHKGDSNSACSNYRPISILHLFSKKFKKLLLLTPASIYLKLRKNLTMP